MLSPDFSSAARSSRSRSRYAPFRRAYGQVAAGLVIGLLIPAAWFATGYLGNDDFNPVPITSLTFINPIADSVQYVMLSTGSTLNFGIVAVAGVIAGSFVTAIATGRFALEGYTSPQHMVRSLVGRGADGRGRRHGLWLLDRARTDGPLHARPAVDDRRRRHPARRRGRAARADPRSGAGDGVTTLRFN